MAVLEALWGDVDVALLVSGAGALWLAAAAWLFATRHPLVPPVGPRTLDLGPEPPAVANLLVNDFRVTGEAVPAPSSTSQPAGTSRSSSAGPASSSSACGASRPRG